MSDLLHDAVRIATLAHSGQRDKAGAPYLQHVLRVLQRIVQDDGSDVAQIVAVLHDVIEDHPEWSAVIETRFPRAVLDALALVTRRHDETYAQFIERIAASDNAVAVSVKLADLDDNLGRDVPASLEARYRHASARLRRRP